MPRIDPLQLLKCLSVLLTSEGGILSRDEVPRLVNLMTKFSKKLVSKCVYLLILKNTEVYLVDMFMESGGWLLVHMWLQEAIATSNWSLVSEILELLLMVPVDSARLRLNSIPKLVKSLSKREDLGDVREMSLTLVNNWLAILKKSSLNHEVERIKDEVEKLEVKEECEEEGEVNKENEIETVVVHDVPEPDKADTEVDLKTLGEDDSISAGLCYKITVRDGKQIISRMSYNDGEEVPQENAVDEIVPEVEAKEKKKEDRHKSSSSRSSSSSKSGSSKGSSSKSSSSSRDKDKPRSGSSRSSSSKGTSSSSSSSSNKDKDRDKDRSRKDRDKDRHKSSSSSKHSSSSSSSNTKSSISKEIKNEEEKEQIEKDKDTLEKLKPQSIDKLGRIPRKSTSVDDKDVKKKPSISIEVRKKTGEERPKTVKIFNSKMRSTGLEEEVKPPPPRIPKKPAPVLPLVLPPVLPQVLPQVSTPSSPKRTSPPKDLQSSPPAEKKLKIEIPERPRSIKLTPPKPKPSFLQESDIFMASLTASATTKKDTKKRKRKLSTSKESPDDSPAIQTSPTPTSPPIGLKNISPANFYQDTLQTETNIDQEKENVVDPPEEDSSNTDDKSSSKETSEDNSESESKRTKTNSDGLKGVLVYVKRKGPKRSIQWKDEDLVEIKYFELDETERVNVSRTNFTDLAKLEMSSERETNKLSRKSAEDLMEPVTLWKIPLIVDQPELPVQPGSKSLEKDIQYARELNTFRAIYFTKNKIPDNPMEPDMENHQVCDPVTIPLEDTESQEYDLRSTPWPEPKGPPPVENIPPVLPNVFPPNMPRAFPNFPQMPPQGFPGIPPGFVPPNMMPNGPPNLIPNNNMNMMGVPPNIGPPMDMMNQGPMNPNMFGPGQAPNFNQMNDNLNFNIPFNQPNVNMFGPPNNFNMNRGGGRGFRRGGMNNNWNRNGPPGPPNWRGGGGGSSRGGRLCKNVKNRGFCRNIDKCPFVHPG